MQRNRGWGACTFDGASSGSPFDSAFGFLLQNVSSLGRMYSTTEGLSACTTMSFLALFLYIWYLTAG